MASVSTNPFTDMMQARTRFVSSPPPGCQQLPCCKDTLCSPPLSPEHESLPKRPNHHPARRREEKLPLAGWSPPGLRRASRCEPGANP